MELIKKYIMQQVAAKQLSSAEATKMFMQLQNYTLREGDIAIIGMACKFPQANSPEEYWDSVINQANCIRDFPSTRRKDTDKLLASYMGTDQPEIIDNYYSKGGFIDETDKFDSFFFRISPREAKSMDPWQRLALETAWEAVEDAGYGGEKLSDTQTGVYIGRDHTNDSHYRAMIQEQDALVATGSWAGVLSGRISYVFNLTGPSVVVDTACSSGLMAVHSACEAIKNNECDQAIAGGIHVAFIPKKGSYISIVESEDFMVKTFDKNANGTVWGEGVGMVFLKPLTKAMEDGDHIYAVIKGTAANNDGMTNGITAPNPEAQEKLFLQAWQNAQIHPETLDYIESHGTGTVLGDPIEIKGLTSAFRKFTTKKQFCGIGSVKPSVGHLVAASGVASLLKTVLALQHKTLPPTINFEEPNAYIRFVESPLYVSNQSREWVRGDAPRRAGVSAFGFSGTNCHIVLEEAPEILRQAGEDEGKPHIFTLSALKPELLKTLVRRHYFFLHQEVAATLQDLCYTVNTGRGHYTARLALLVDSLEDLKTKMAIVNKQSWDEIKEDWFYYAEHRVVSNSKKVKEAGEMFEDEKRDITGLAHLKVRELGQMMGDPYRDSLKELGQMYIQGADVLWDELYQGNKYQRVSMPLYPLERIRYWVEDAIVKRESAKQTTKQISHPLLDYCLAESLHEDIFVTEMSIDRHWVLRDHQVMGNCVIPGTTYLEMAREVSRKYYPTGPIHLQDVLFLAPLMVTEGEVKEVQTIVSKREGYLEFTMATKTDETNWVQHAMGRITEAQPLTAGPFDVAGIKQNFTDEVRFQFDILDKTPTSSPFRFGLRWGSYLTVSLNPDRTEVWVQMDMLEEIQSDLRDYVLHPGLLDQVVNVAIRQVGEGLYLPLSYKSFMLYGAMPESFYGYVRIKEKSSSSKETFNFDITLTDLSGQIFAEITDYTIKKVRKAELTFAGDQIYHQLAWVEEELVAVENTNPKGSVLLFTDGRALAKNLGEYYAAQGRPVIEVELGDTYRKVSDHGYTISGVEDDYLRLIGELKNAEIAQIVHFPSIPTKAITSVSDLQNALHGGIYSLFYLTRALVSEKVKQEIQIALITHDSDRVTGADERIYPHHASYAGLGKVVGQEYPNLHCRCIDLDEGTTPLQVWEELQTSQAPYQVAYRQGKRYVQELRPLEVSEQPAREMTIQEDGVYLITGGTGGLGLEMAKYLAEKGKIHLALLNRSQLPERQEWEQLLAESEDQKLLVKLRGIQAIEALGAHVETLTADISNDQQMATIIQKLREKYGRINGIIHAAGVAGDGFMVLKEEETFSQVLAPKILGTWILGQLTEADDLDFFVLFSSITAVMAGMGQGDYTAANAYMDSFAAASPTNRLSINWTAWKETGMAVDYGVNENEGIFKAITTEKAVNCFDLILNKALTNVIIGEIHYQHPVFNNLEHFPLRVNEKIKETLQRYQRRSASQSTAQARRELMEIAMTGRSSDDYTETEKKLSQIWGNVLGLKDINIYDDFYQLGGDSIMAIKLVNIANEHLNQELTINDLFEYLTIADLATYLDSQVPERGIAEVQVTPSDQQFYDLAPAQKQLWFVQQADPGLTGYNLHAALPIQLDGLQPKVVENMLNQFISRHDALRTIFFEEDGIPKQTVLDRYELELEIVDLREETDKDHLHKKILKRNDHPFDFSKPLIRAKLYQAEQNKYYLYLNLHHIISDGWSMGIAYQELTEMLKAYTTGQQPSLAPLGPRYIDWIQEQHNWLASQQAVQAEEYWVGELSLPLPDLNLPLDYPRPDRLTYSGSYVSTVIREELTEQLRERSKKMNTTLYVLLQSAYLLLLNKVTADEDIIIGAPVTGRTKKELENLIGLFVNMICIRVRFNEIATFADLLGVVKEKSLAGIKYGQYPFSLLVNKVNPERNLSRHPLFSTVFQYYDILPLENEQVALNDLSFFCSNNGDNLYLRAEYKADLFKQETIEKLLQNYLIILEQIVESSNRAIDDFQLDANYAVIETKAIDDELDFSF